MDNAAGLTHTMSPCLERESAGQDQHIDKHPAGKDAGSKRAERVGKIQACFTYRHRPCLRSGQASPGAWQREARLSSWLTEHPALLLIIGPCWHTQPSPCAVCRRHRQEIYISKDDKQPLAPLQAD